MRTISTAQTQVLAAPHRSSHIKVEVYDGSSWINLSDHCGKDWLASVTYGESQDGRVADATFVVQLADHELNMSPLMTASHCNDPNVVLDLSSNVKIYGAVMALEQTPAAADWVLVFSGSIDSWQINGNQISVMCTDDTRDLADAFVEKEKDYGNSSDDMSSVIQDILDDWSDVWGTNWTLWSPTGVAGTEFGDGTGGTSDDRPGWAIHKYRQKREPVLDALATMAKTIGWDLRYRWQTNSGDFELQMWEPDRAKAGGTNYTFGTDEIFSIEASLSRRPIRNYVRVTYFDEEDNKQAEDDSDATSITNNGRRWCELAEGQSSQIDSSTEAATLAGAAVDDMATPIMTATMVVPYFPWAQLQDVYTITANNTQFSGNQTLAVIGIRHSSNGKSAKTTLTLQGSPSLGVAGYLKTQRQTIKRKFDNFNVRILSTERNQCPNGDFSQWDGG